MQSTGKRGKKAGPQGSSARPQPGHQGKQALDERPVPAKEAVAEVPCPSGAPVCVASPLAPWSGPSAEDASHCLPGWGTRVRIERQGDDDPAPLPDPLPPTKINNTVAPTSSPLRMLYVEDNRINAILFEGALRMHNTSVELRVAEDGAEAVAIAREWHPEVLVLDAHLPDMSGFEVLQILRVMPGLAMVPAFMCSADAMPEDVQRAQEAGFAGYWTKPIDVSGVLADVNDLARRLRPS